MILEELAGQDGAAAVEAVDEKGPFGRVDEVEKVSGVIDAEDFQAETLGHQHVDEPEAEGIALTVFETPGEIGISRVEGI